MINLILFGSFFVMLLLNIPIAVSLGMSSIFALLFSSSPLTVVPTNVYSGMAKFLLLAIPFFVLSGNIMAKAGISSRLVAFADDCVGHRRGGIAIVAVIVACFFGAISGSGPATVAALGIILIPAMINRGGFSAPFASSLMASASSIAIVIPPSIAFVVYASITGVSVGDMFMGGWIPGIMMGLSLVIIIMIECRKKGIPFFVLSGNIMAKAGISSRLVAFADDCVGHRRGGIAIVAVIVACFFGAISGSGPATVAALGIILIPAMINRGGFSAPFASSLMASASSIAIVIPPSIAFVVYASITGVSVGDMFMGGWIPGIMMGLSLVIIIMIECRKKGIQASKAKSSWGQRWKSFREAFWGFLMPVIIIGGIYGGVFTPTEAAAVSVVYGLVVGVFIYREVKMKDMIDILVDSGKTTGGIMLIIGAATLFSYVCTVFGIAQAAQALLLEISGNKYIFLLIVNVIFLIAGCFVDANSAMYIFIPIMYPVATQLGIDPVHFGVIATVNLAIGQVTPPVGVNLFVAIGVSEKLQGLRDKTKVTIVSMSKAVWPQIVACIIALLLITYVPWFSTVLLFGK